MASGDATGEGLVIQVPQDLSLDASSKIEELETENASLKALLDTYKDRIDKLSLETKDATDKLGKEKQNAMDDIQKKNGIIDKMRVKLNRYEFAIKEAILFLSKPMEGYETWLTSKADSALNGSQAMLAAAVAGAISAAGSNAPPSPSPSRVYQDPGRSRSPSSAPKPSAWTSLAPSLSKDNRSNSQAALPNASSHGSTTPSGDSKLNGATNLEIQCLECMRLALNYLKNAQSSVQAMGRDGSEVTSSALSPPPRLIADGSRLLSQTVLEMEEEISSADEKAVQAGLTVALNDLEKKALSPDKKTTSPKSSSPESHQPKSPLSVTSASQTSQTSLLPHHNHATGISNNRSKSPQRSPLSMDRGSTNTLTSQALIHAAEALPEEEDGDITASKGSSYSTGSSAASKKCGNCRDLRLQVEHHVDTINQLRENITNLANEIEEQKATIDRIQLSKDILDQELEELTAQLFDQANRMVIDEARMREELENTNRDLRGELKELLQKSEGREDELKELRRNLRALEAAKNRSQLSFWLCKRLESILERKWAKFAKRAISSFLLCGRTALGETPEPICIFNGHSGWTVVFGIPRTHSSINGSVLATTSSGDSNHTEHAIYEEVPIRRR
ncbi:hypothetical protein HDU97_009486 [Phlyctochytrium planicorne]|nr:hypothetical protein HDU97_009486 [Phlyctochytrium planicorne]